MASESTEESEHVSIGIMIPDIAIAFGDMVLVIKVLHPTPSTYTPHPQLTSHTLNLHPTTSTCTPHPQPYTYESLEALYLLGTCTHGTFTNTLSARSRWYSGTSRIRDRPTLGPYNRHMPAAQW